MAAVYALILFQIVFSFLHQGLGLISDYKLCGDPECERMISRVQAQRDHSAKDCRFLNFKKGDMITVYYKLTGKRNDLWAGSIEKLSGLFPKDAIKVDQLFIDEKKEIQVPTQEYDFICFDDKGLVIEPSSEFDDLEDLSQETNLNEVEDKPTETEESEPSQISVQDVSDQNSPKTTEKGGSSWIGSAVSGWFGRNEQSNDEPQDEISEVSFKSRKIEMDIEENHVEEKTNSGTFGWISGELTNAFGLGNKDLKTDAQDNIENPTNDEDTSSQQSSSLESMGRDVLDLSEDHSEAATKHEAEKTDENLNNQDESILNLSQNMGVDDNIQRDENNLDSSVENKDGPLEDRKTENGKEEEQAGWYGNMYNRITNLYKEEQTKDDEDDGGNDKLESPGSATNTETTETKDSESSSQSVFSVNSLTSMLKLPFQADSVVKRDEEMREKEEHPGLEDFDEEQKNNEDQEEEMLTDIDEQDSNPTDTDVLSVATDNLEQLDEVSNMTKYSTYSQILENKSADNLTDELQNENITEFFEGKVEQVTRDVKSDEEQTGKEEDPGKEDFDEEQNNYKDQEEKVLIDIYEQDSNPIDTDVHMETQSLSNKTITLKDSIEQLDVGSNMTDDSIDSQILETKSADHLNQEVKHENNVDFFEGKVEQNPRDVQSDQEKKGKEEDPGKEDFDEEQNNYKDQEEKVLIDIYEQDSNPIDTDVHMETQSLSNKTITLKDSIEQLDVGSNMTDDSIDSQILETKSADHLNQEVKHENNVDFFEGKVEQNPRDVQSDPEKKGKEEDPGKEDFDEKQNNYKDQEDKMLTDIYKQDSNPTDTDMLSEKTMTFKDSIASDSIEQLDVESKMTEDNIDSQILETKSANDLTEEVKSENNADVLDGAVEKNMKDVQSDKEKTGKEANSGRGDFIEQQNVNNEEISDVVKQKSTTKDVELLSETQVLSDETITLKDSVASDYIRDIDDFSKESNAQNVDEIKSANTNDKVIESTNNLTDSADDISKGKLTQSLCDQGNLDIIKQQEKDANETSADPVTDANTSELSDIQTGTQLHHEKTQESNVADLYADSHTETLTAGQSVNADVNAELIMDALSEYNNEKQLAEGDQGISKENDELVIDRKDELVMERNEAQLDEVLPKDITFHQEKLSDSEARAMQMSNEHKLGTNINPLDERSSPNHTLVADELTVTSEEKLHSELESNSSLNVTDYEIDNTSESHHESLVTENSGISIVKDTDSVGKYDDEAIVHEEQEKPDTVSEHTGHDPSLPKNADIDNIPNAVAEDLDGFTTSSETELTNEFFSKNDSVQDGNINIMHEQNQSVEHKVETDTANNEDCQTDSESVRQREESGTGAIWDQSDDGDMAVKSKDKEEHSDEEKPGSLETQDKKTANEPTETSKEYTNLYPHLSEQNIEDLLDLFGHQKLSWLDSKMGNVNAGQDNDDIDELGDFEQLLDYHMKMNTKLGHIQQDNGFPGRDNAKEYPALQKLLTLLSSQRTKYSPVITDNSLESPGISKDDCVHEACLDVNKNTQISTIEAENNQVTEDRADINDLGNPQNEPVSEEKDLSANRANVEDVQTDEQDIQKHEDWTSSETKKSTFQNHGLISEEHVESQKGEGQFRQMAVFVEVTINEIASIVNKVVSSLPDDIRPGPDLYGLPWEAVVFTGFLGLFTLLLFSCRFIHSIRSRLYASKEKQMALKVAELLDEKCKVLETFSEVKRKFDKLESTLQNNGMSAQAAEKDNLEVASQKLEQSNAQMKNEIERLQEELSQQNKARKQQEDQLAELEQILRNLEEEAKERKSQLEQDNTTLKIHEINTERLQKNLQAAKEEHAILLESKAQLVQEAEDWGERLGELEEEMKMCERSHTSMLEDCANKDDRIKSLTEHLLKMRDWDSEDESCVDGSTNTAGAENGDSSDFHQKQKVQKLIEAAKMSADLKSMEEDKNRVFATLADEIKAKEDLQEGIKQLEEQKEVLESESANYASESQKLQQKLQIMTEMYQENELKLHRMLTVEEKERLQKEEKLNKAGKKISLAAEELYTYRQRAKDLEEELERTSQAYKNQFASHEKKAHDNWLAARAADRDLADVKRENAHLRQRLTDAQFKFEILEKDLREGRPLFRGERSPFGPSPLSRPSSETRAFLSPPTLMDGPLRLSPQFMGPGRGHPLPDPGMPFRRPPPGLYHMGPLPPRPPLPSETYFGDKSDSSFLRNSSSISENENRDGPHSMPGDMRLPPDPDLRMGPPLGPPLMGMPPLMDPRGPHFPPRGPYGPPEFFPPRGPGGPPMGMRGPFPPGMFPRAPMPLPQHMGYLPPRPPSDSFSPRPPPRPSPPGSEQPPDQSPSPHDVI
ncbi:melanoma inhibitory activity protein 2 isoform X2 [Carassius gibelio]|uniref:melanoma inhibitory activity protein 2 isoform X2 n=1 Tax=Carassius gibelio TaxID=101364 RepID=UPI0022796C02|nr:melanoma inhibitory activity protein 2 isoform X2 [Carassius gibelio]